MKNFKKLSRNDLRNVTGGQSCSVVVKNANGTYTTHYGTCKSRAIMNSDILDTQVQNGLINAATGNQSYCEFGSGEVKLSSNGGVSRCNG